MEVIIGSLNMGLGRVRRLLGALDIMRRISSNSRKRNIMMKSSEYLISIGGDVSDTQVSSI